MSTIKPIETIYNGRRYRSRLEARWSVFFDDLGIEYLYEPEGYELPPDVMAGVPNTTWYLPDFWLPRQRYWIEIKPDRPSPEEELKIAAVARYQGAKAFILWGDVIPPFEQRSSSDSHYIVWPYWDNYQCWCVCPLCGAVEIQFEGRAWRMACRCLRSKEPRREKLITSEDGRLIRAYTRAKMARFEHGEQP
jgi:hypothetical protein